MNTTTHRTRMSLCSTKSLEGIRVDPELKEQPVSKGQGQCLVYQKHGLTEIGKLAELSNLKRNLLFLESDVFFSKRQLLKKSKEVCVSFVGCYL